MFLLSIGCTLVMPMQFLSPNVIVQLREHRIVSITKMQHFLVNSFGCFIKQVYFSCIVLALY